MSRAQRAFNVTPWNTVLAGTRHHTSVQTVEGTALRVNPNVYLHVTALGAVHSVLP